MDISSSCAYVVCSVCNRICDCLFSLHVYNNESRMGWEWDVYRQIQMYWVMVCVPTERLICTITSTHKYCGGCLREPAVIGVSARCHFCERVLQWGGVVCVCLNRPNSCVLQRECHSSVFHDAVCCTQRHFNVTLLFYFQSVMKGHCTCMQLARINQELD